MIENLTFVVLEGLLSESEEFLLYRGYETTHAEAGLRFGSNVRDITVALIDQDGHIISAVAPVIHFPLGCTAEVTRPGVGLLRAAIAFNHQARRIELRSHARLIYAGEIAMEQPELSDLGVSVSDGAARVVFDVGNSQPDLQLLARLGDGRHLRPPAQRNGNEYKVDLHLLEGLGEATFVVEATSDFRTSRAETSAVALPPASVRGLIIEPSPGSEWPFGWRGNLIGSLFDRNGRRIDWTQQQVAWVIDDEAIDGSRQLMPWQAEEPGEHHIQLVHEIGNGQIEVLDEITITVLPQTEEQKEYMALITAREAREVAANYSR
jgi:hypothetical protein